MLCTVQRSACGHQAQHKMLLQNGSGSFEHLSPQHGGCACRSCQEYICLAEGPFLGQPGQRGSIEKPLRTFGVDSLRTEVSPLGRFARTGRGNSMARGGCHFQVDPVWGGFKGKPKGNRPMTSHVIILCFRMFASCCRFRSYIYKSCWQVNREREREIPSLTPIQSSLTS